MTEVATYPTVQAAAGQPGRVMGGGTLLMRQVNYAPQSVDRLLRITDAALREVRVEGDASVIGAGVTMAQVIANPDLAALAPPARSIGGPTLRNMATVGGNLYAPSPYGDFTVALLAAGAQVVWADGRTEDLEAFLRGRDQARGIVAAIRVPRLRPDQLRYRKVSRTKPKGVSVMSIAARLDGPGGPRIAFGAMGPTPLRAPSAEAALTGGRTDERSVEAACAACLGDLQPQDDALASGWYRAQVAPVHLRRLLTGAA